MSLRRLRHLASWLRCRAGCWRERRAGPKRGALLVNLDNLGDFIMFSPLLGRLHGSQHGPLGLLCREDTRPLAGMLPGVDAVWQYSRTEPESLPAHEELKMFLKHEPLVRQLQGQGFRWGFSVSTNAFNASIGNLLLDWLGCEERVGFALGGFQGRLSHSIAVRPDLHWTENYLRLLQPLGLPAHYQTPRLEPGRQQPARWGTGAGPRIALQPGGRSYSVERRWPLERFVRLGQQLLQRGYQLLLLGDAADGERCAGLAQGLQGRVSDLCGRTSLVELADLLRQVDGLVCNDGGVLHLAAAVGCPRIVALFGPTSAHRLMPRPESPAQRWRALESGLDCAPCVTETFPLECRRGEQICLHVADVADVLRALELPPARSA